MDAFNKINRRDFLQQSGKVAATGVLTPAALSLAGIADASAFTAPDGSYKALVCVFLYGGNDYANTVVAFDNDSHAAYSAIRGSMALSKNSLLATALQPQTPLPNGRKYAFHPSMLALSNLFNTGKAAVQLNVGPLVVPVTRTQFLDSNKTLYPLPPKLFSHNDQQSQWQAFAPEGATVGWGGGMADLMLNANNQSGGKATFTSISVAGNSVFSAGRSAVAYQSSLNGSVKINALYGTDIYGMPAVKSAIAQLIKQPKNHVLENEYSLITQRSVAAEATLSTALTTGAATGMGAEFAPFANVANTNLAMQLKTVARTIAARATLGVKRQVFFVSLGGFDLHDNLLGGQMVLLKNLSDSLAAFYETTVNLGVANQVTSFTASDFGRTLTSNGDGSDHGWGNHHIVVGGAVNGQQFYGYAPPISVGDSTNLVDQFHTGQGRLIPTTSIEQYAGTMAKWMGVQDAELDVLFPNLKNFSNKQLGDILYQRDTGMMRA